MPTTGYRSALLVRLRRLRDSGGTQGNAKAEAVVPVRRNAPAPERRSTNRGLDSPTAATEHAARALFGANRVANRTL